MNRNTDYSDAAETPLKQFFAGILQSGDRSQMLDMFDALPVNDISEEIGARLIARDFFLQQKGKVESLSLDGVDMYNVRDTLRDYLNGVTDDMRSAMKRLPDYSGKDPERPRGLAAERLRQEARALPKDQLTDFVKNLPDILKKSSEQKRHADDPLWFANEFIPLTRNRIVENFQEVRQDALEDAGSDVVSADFDRAKQEVIDWLNKLIVASIPVGRNE